MVTGWLVAPKVSLVSVLCSVIMKSEHAYFCVVTKSLVTRAMNSRGLKRTHVCAAISFATVVAASMSQHPDMSSSCI
jgi:hypothetical protein